MKRFDKGYIYSGLLSGLLRALVVVFIFLRELLLDEEPDAEEVRVAIPILVIGFAVLYLCFIVYRILYYACSGYELTEKEIICKRGVLFRTRSVLDYKKIHAVNKNQNIFHRIFGIAILTVDSGSANTAHQAEITIIEKDKVVDDLLDKLNLLKSGGAQTEESDQPNDRILLSDEDSLFSFTSGRKMLYTLINIASAAFFTALFAVLATTVLGLYKLMIEQSFLGSWGEYFLGAFLITIVLILAISMFSFVGCLLHSFVEYHKFKITKCANGIQISYGLLDKHTNTFSYDRIKAVKITQTLVQRMLGFASIRLEVIGYTVNSGDDNNNAAPGVLVPFCKYDETDVILGKVLPDYVPDKKQARAVSFFPFISWFALFLGITIGVVLLQASLIMMILNVSSSVISSVALAIAGVGAVILAVKALSAALRYQNNGLAVSGGKITAYYGGFTKNVTVFMSRNLIAAESITTPLRQKKGITSLVMHLKTNALTNEIKVDIQKDTCSDDMEKLLKL